MSPEDTQIRLDSARLYSPPEISFFIAGPRLAPGALVRLGGKSWRRAENLKSLSLVILIRLLLRAAAVVVAFALSSAQPTPALTDRSELAASAQPPARYSEPSPAPVQAYHHTGIRDVGAIGDRNVGCGRGVGNWYSLKSQVSLGKKLAQQVESTAKLIHDPMVTGYVNRIGQNLVRNSDARLPFTIKVIDSDEINAFALPGGFFYVNSGLLVAADDEAELASIMAHEIGHVAACHATRERTRGRLLNLASIPLIFVGGGIGFLAVESASMTMSISFFKFSRSFEAQADYLGVQYLYKSGYDPQAFLTFFEKIQATEKNRVGRLAKAFGTHPPTADRIKALQEEIATILPSRNEYILDTSEFGEVKTRLAAIDNRLKLRRDNDSDGPTLRRAPENAQMTESEMTSGRMR